MTTFTTSDRENAMNEPAVIVNSGASVMTHRPMTDEYAQKLLSEIHITKYESIRDYGMLVIRLTEKHYGIKSES